MKKLLFFANIIMGIACIMMAALFFSLRKKGSVIFVTGIGAVEPMIMIAILMVFSILFFIFASRIALK